MCIDDYRIETSSIAKKQLAELVGHQRALVKKLLLDLADDWQRGCDHIPNINVYVQGILGSESKVRYKFGVKIIYGVEYNRLTIDWISIDPTLPHGGGPGSRRTRRKKTPKLPELEVDVRKLAIVWTDKLTARHDFPATWYARTINPIAVLWEGYAQADNIPWTALTRTRADNDSLNEGLAARGPIKGTIEHGVPAENLTCTALTWPRTDGIWINGTHNDSLAARGPINIATVTKATNPFCTASTRSRTGSIWAYGSLNDGLAADGQVNLAIDTLPWTAPTRSPTESAWAYGSLNDGLAAGGQVNNAPEDKIQADSLPWVAPITKPFLGDFEYSGASRH
jgi:hypothetical protein